MMENNVEDWSEKQIKRRAFFSFLTFGLAGTAGVLGFRWYKSLPETNNGLSETTRKVLSFNEQISNLSFGNNHLAKTYSKIEAAKEPRVNGDVGVDSEIDLEAWKLEIALPNNTFYVGIDEIKALPKEEVVFEFKCIEGWSQVVHYSGVRFSDFLKKYNLGMNETTQNLFNYAGLETPDGAYFVGLDMKSVMHPQTLLCYEMNGEALPQDHGAPLRLIIPVKYGVKNLKRIGKLFFADSPPRDYWHQLGYTYDAAL